MTGTQLISSLFEWNDDVKREHQVELDRVLLRLYHSPALLTHLKDTRFIDEDQVEMEFALLPNEAVQTIGPLIGPIKVEAYSFTKDGEPRHGFRFKTSDLFKAYEKDASSTSSLQTVPR